MLAGYYQKNKESLHKTAHERYQNLSEKDKNKKRQYTHERYINSSGKKRNKKQKYSCESHKSFQDGKQRLAEYREIKTD